MVTDLALGLISLRVYHQHDATVLLLDDWQLAFRHVPLDLFLLLSQNSARVAHHLGILLFLLLFVFCLVIVVHCIVFVLGVCGSVNHVLHGVLLVYVSHGLLLLDPGPCVHRQFLFGLFLLVVLLGLTSMRLGG